MWGEVWCTFNTVLITEPADTIMITCVINICHIVALCCLTPVVIDNAKKPKLELAKFQTTVI